ncbi:MAG: nucleoside hydrolase [Bacteroidota bacterium]
MRIFAALLLMGSMFTGCHPASDVTPLADEQSAVTDQCIPVILDSDANNELDDQHAIAYMLLNRDRFDVKGITVNRTHNGGDIHEQYAEAERVVQVLNLLDEVPIYKGADGSFEDIRPTLSRPNYDGHEAVEFIVATARSYTPEAPLVLLPVGKLTNIALALEAAPDIADRVRIVWLGSNYPEPGEYNQENDLESVRYVYDYDVPLEVALVRYGAPSATDAVRITPDEAVTHLAGKGPVATTPITGRHGGTFVTFGDYAVNLFDHIEMYGNPPSRALFDMAAVAIVKEPSWAMATEVPAPLLQADGTWVERPDNPRTIILWENYDRDAIVEDLYRSLDAVTP